jgi:hypothetical protein
MSRLTSSAKRIIAGGMTQELILQLDANTADWLQRQALAEQTTPVAFVEEILRELADPEQIEGDLIDRLLAQAVSYFPPVMTLDEQDEYRDEVLDHLCGRIATIYQQQIGTGLNEQEIATLRVNLANRSESVWPAR